MSWMSFAQSVTVLSNTCCRLEHMHVHKQEYAGEWDTAATAQVKIE